MKNPVDQFPDVLPGGASPSPRALPGRILLEQYRLVRARTEALAAPLSDEDQVIQSMPDASPTKWHLAHTTWFWETFVLEQNLPGYTPFDLDFPFLFNSYYESLGPRHPRPQRGLLSRPGSSRVADYRHYVDRHIEELLGTLPVATLNSLEPLVRLGLAHEQQHQELLLMDILHLFSQSPLHPAYRSDWPRPDAGRPGKFRTHHGGLVSIGDAESPFAFDNERPRHRTWIEPFEISDRLVTNRDWLRFMNDGGYTTARHWLSDGWDRVRAEGWDAPLYWRRSSAEQGWTEITLRGLEPLDLDAPVMHISYYEAAAFAAWADARLPTESEWEIAARAGLLEQADDVAWQWTCSAYMPYPGFKPTADAAGEYNGKFMSGQMVLRGAAFATPDDHTRPSYRNFFRPEQRWMFSGVRLARNTASGNGDGEHDLLSGTDAFARDVLEGLSRPVKSLPSKYFYDAQGSALFEAICATPEYYPTRTETALLKDIAAQFASEIPDHATLVEFGSGASTKTRIILDAARQIGTYVPIDISTAALEQARQRIADAYPALEVRPVAGDFTRDMALPDMHGHETMIGFFPGSTIGNFEPADAIAFLRSAKKLLGSQAKLIVGVDMVKDAPALLSAYNDEGGVTARFNLNLLLRINRELEGNFELSAFAHSAIWNDDLKRIEMHLVSRAKQTVRVLNHDIHFEAGESMHTENSHKYTTDSFEELASSAGWEVTRSWVSNAPRFGVFLLEAVARE
ncbi:ergothioneine biosynthesis protein EgtB [Paraburkholderia mimosarum]|uniref:ergothioneine biosynthesis protein EgtB n=1 Tax=Paraburkholderia mimosarum TaxID=312026 RepID=UPI0009DF77C9